MWIVFHVHVQAMKTNVMSDLISEKMNRSPARKVRNHCLITSSLSGFRGWSRLHYMCRRLQEEGVLCCGSSAQSGCWLTCFCQSGPQNCIRECVGGCRTRGRSGRHSDTTGTAPELLPTSPAGFHPSPGSTGGHTMHSGTPSTPDCCRDITDHSIVHLWSIFSSSRNHWLTSAWLYWRFLLWTQKQHLSIDNILIRQTVNWSGTVLYTPSVHIYKCFLHCRCSEPVGVGAVKDTHTLVELASLAAGDEAFTIWIPGHAGQAILMRLTHLCS